MFAPCSNFSDGGGGTTNDTGQIDGADLFGGDDDYVTVASPTGLDPASQVTVSAWVRVDGPIALNGDISIFIFSIVLSFNPCFKRN